jgi:type VI secretion system secreted protein VgrG
VQYRETDLNFVSRLMEEEGIYTYFHHEKGKHTLIVCDAPGAHQSVGDIPYRPNFQQARIGTEYVREWSVTREIQPGKAALRDYNFETPSTDLTVKSDHARQHGESEHEIFDYPGEYPDPGIGDHRVRTRLEEMQAAHEVIAGSGNARLITCGSLFTLKDFVRTDQNREYLVVSTLIEARNNFSEAVEATYRCSFRLIPGDVTYRPPRTTPRPIVQGPQTAIVVGPAGEEIHVDKYGRIKVQFYWDRLGKKDDASSCWMRVSQIWAGKNYGWMTIPRIGQEVIVDFLEGDADHPIVTGRVYNAEQMPPWALPANKTQSGILTRSSKEGAPANANEFRFEDKKGSEQVFLHAEKNYDIEVEADETHWVGHDRKKTIDNDENVEVKNNRTEKVGVDESITIGSNRTENVGSNEDITIGVNRTENVGSNENITIGANRSESVGASESISIAASRDLMVGGSETRLVGGSSTETIGGSLSQTVAGGITITTPGSMSVTAIGGVTVTAPGGFKVMAPGGTKIVDMTLDELGGIMTKTYGQILKATPINLETNGLKAEVHGIKVDKGALFNKTIQAKMISAGLSMQLDESAAVHKAGAALAKASIFLFG